MLNFMKCTCFYILILYFSFFVKLEAKEILLEGKASYFFSTNKLFRNVYGGAGLYRIESNFPLFDHFYLWCNLGYMYGSGHSSLGNSTHLHFIPLSVGLSYFFPLKSFSPYLGLGPVGAYSHIYNSYKYVTRHQDGWGGGFLAKAGLITSFAKSFFFDAFIDYSFVRMSFHHQRDKYLIHNKGDLSGLNFGAGLGYCF